MSAGLTRTVAVAALEGRDFAVGSEGVCCAVVQVVAVIERCAILANGENLLCACRDGECRSRGGGVDIDIIVGTEACALRDNDGAVVRDLLSACG